MLHGLQPARQLHIGEKWVAFVCIWVVQLAYRNTPTIMFAVHTIYAVKLGLRQGTLPPIIQQPKGWSVDIEGVCHHSPNSILVLPEVSVQAAIVTAVTACTPTPRPHRVGHLSLVKPYLARLLLV